MDRVSIDGLRKLAALPYREDAHEIHVTQATVRAMALELIVLRIATGESASLAAAFHALYDAAKQGTRDAERAAIICTDFGRGAEMARKVAIEEAILGVTPAEREHLLGPKVDDRGMPIPGPVDEADELIGRGLEEKEEHRG